MSGAAGQSNIGKITNFGLWHDFDLSTVSKSTKTMLASTGIGKDDVVYTVKQNPTGAYEKQTVPVEITFKPNPVYTEEGRNLRIEGEVLLDVVFHADGTLHVNRVIRGLGHGLDESAIAAANKIRFKLATADGHAVDSEAVVHVVFQLAY